MNQKLRFWLVTIGACFHWAHAADRSDNLVVLDATSTANLGIETVPVTRQDFEKTLFALGRIEVIPANRAVVSSRVAGRVTRLSATEGDRVMRGAAVAQLESRQPGDPPPLIDLTAPIGGLVSAGHARLGEPVEPDKPILELLDLSEVYAVAHLPEEQAGLLSAETRARITIPALAETVHHGKLLRFSTEVDEASGTIGAIFLLSNTDLRIRPHMRAEFSIVTAVRSQVLAVPRSAVLEDAVGRSVFVADFELPNTFQKTVVRTGMRNDEYVEILQGIFPGDSVVMRGAYPLAYAGGGTLSLKEALDAAHGHEHNEDGSEMTAADRARAAAARAGNQGGAPMRGMTFFLGGLVLLLLVLLGLSQWQLMRLRLEHRNRSGGADA